MYLTRPVHYLTDTDVDAQGKLINPAIPKGMPVIVMIQANFCGHCNVAKPAFQELTDKYDGKIFAATIQGDGKEPGEKELTARIKTMKPSFRGFPDYVLFIDGAPVNKDVKGRSLKDLEEFVGV
jgi:thiol-disulfide isomerase/thioredoxin